MGVASVFECSEALILAREAGGDGRRELVELHLESIETSFQAVKSLSVPRHALRHGTQIVHELFLAHLDAGQ